jgi:hypothetical protein
MLPLIPALSMLMPVVLPETTLGPASSTTPFPFVALLWMMAPTRVVS